MPQMTETEQHLTTAQLAAAASGADQQAEKRDEHGGSLLAPDVSEEMRTRWEAIQTEFVDDPRTSVQQADELVAMAIKRLAESFAAERGKLEQEWSSGNNVSTEDLRQALRRYRAFFHRLLSI